MIEEVSTATAALDVQKSADKNSDAMVQQSTLAKDILGSFASKSLKFCGNLMQITYFDCCPVQEERYTRGIIGSIKLAATLITLTVSNHK